jgi:hypothetical protein
MSTCCPKSLKDRDCQKRRPPAGFLVSPRLYNRRHLERMDAPSMDANADGDATAGGDRTRREGDRAVKQLGQPHVVHGRPVGEMRQRHDAVLRKRAEAAREQRAQVVPRDLVPDKLGQNLLAQQRVRVVLPGLELGEADLRHAGGHVQPAIPGVAAGDGLGKAGLVAAARAHVSHPSARCSGLSPRALWRAGRFQVSGHEPFGS